MLTAIQNWVNGRNKYRSESSQNLVGLNGDPAEEFTSYGRRGVGRQREKAIDSEIEKNGRLGKRSENRGLGSQPCPSALDDIPGVCLRC